jgi:selenocysteine lyase/cysteine desulfurase
MTRAPTKGPDAVAPWVKDFGPFDGRVWLNAAHQGALSRPARDAAADAVAWKVQPWEMTTERFSQTPETLRRALAGLIGADPDDVILANSASYGLHLLANGIPWRDGDEVLVMQGDFPSDILPWMGLADRGVSVRPLKPRGRVLDADEIAAAIGPRTRLLCLTWVHSFSGHAIDLDAIGRLCREQGVLFVANAAQAIGVRPLDVSTAPVDAVVGVGWKFLCGPYGTGFAWMRPEVRRVLRYNQSYWLNMLTSDDLGRDALDLTLRADVGARRYDVFGTANFFNFVPFGAAVTYLAGLRLERVRDYVNSLVQRFVDGLDRDLYRLISPERGTGRSTLIVISHRDRARNEAVHAALRAKGIHVAVRAGALRVAPHLYNTPADIDRALDAFDRAAR